MRRKTLSIGIIVVALTALVPVRSVQAAQASQTFGNATAGSLTDSGDSNYLNGSRFVTGSTGGTLTSMSVYVAAIDAAPNNKTSSPLRRLWQQARHSDRQERNWHSGGVQLEQPAVSATVTANTNYWLM